MTEAVPAPSSGRAGVLLALVGLGALVGVVAVLLSGATPEAPTRAGQLVVSLPADVWGILYLSPLLAGIAAVLVQRIRNGATPIGRGSFLTYAAMFLVVLVLLYVFATAAPTGGGGSVSVTNPAPSPPSTPPPPSNGAPGGSNGSSVPTPDTVTITSLWLIVIAVVLCAVVAALAVPGVLSRVVDRRRTARASPGARPGIERALAEAGAAIDRGEDVRETIVRLYVRLLEAIAPRAGDVAYLTPDEIRRQVLASLGVRPGASEALTRLFEEARYSSHPIPSSEGGRFRAAIGQVEDDLRRGTAS